MRDVVVFHSHVITDYFTSTRATHIGRKEHRSTIITSIIPHSDYLLSPSGRRSRRTLPADLDAFRLALRLALFGRAGEGHVDAEPTGTRGGGDRAKRAAAGFLVPPLVLLLRELLAHLLDVALGLAGARLFDDGLGERYAPRVHGRDRGVAPDCALEPPPSDHDGDGGLLDKVVGR